MKPQTEELLYFLMWCVDQAMRPTYANLTGNFESWAWHEGLGPRLQRLARDRLVESRHVAGSLDRVVRLTEAGRRLALGGRDPEMYWRRGCDGKWRLVLFDLPVTARRLRKRLWRRLKQLHLGCLQGSVWLSPDPLPELRAVLAGGNVDARILILGEFSPCAGESDVDLVRGAWDFVAIDAAYRRLEAILENPPRGAAAIPDWCRREQAAWAEVATIDPFLPSMLCPREYRGVAVWRRRQRVLRQLIQPLGAVTLRSG